MRAMGRVVACVGGGIINSMKMKRLLKGLLILTGLLAASIAALVAWAYVPVAKFEPVAYKPTATELRLLSSLRWPVLPSTRANRRR